MIASGTMFQADQQAQVANDANCAHCEQALENTLTNSFLLLNLTNHLLGMATEHFLFHIIQV